MVLVACPDASPVSSGLGRLRFFDATAGEGFGGARALLTGPWAGGAAASPVGAVPGFGCATCGAVGCGTEGMPPGCVAGVGAIGPAACGIPGTAMLLPCACCACCA